MTTPNFGLTRVYDDGTYEVEIYPLTGLSADTTMDRRDFLGVTGTGLSIATLLALIPTQAEAAKKSGQGPSACANAFAHQGPVLALAVSPDGEALFTGSADETIKVWSLPDGGHLETLEWPKAWVHALAVSPDGKILAAGNNEYDIVLWDLEHDSQTRRLSGHHGLIHALAFSPDGQFLISGSTDSSLKLWQWPDGKLAKTLSGHRGAVDALAISADGKTLVSGGTDGTIRLWSLPDGAPQKTLTHPGGPVHALAISRDGSTLAAGGESSTITLWDLPAGEPAGTLQGHKDSVMALAISPDGAVLLSGSQDDTIRLWDLGERSLQNTIKQHKGGVYALAITPGGDCFASASEDKTARLWNFPEGTAVACLMDLAASPPTTKGVTIKHTRHTKRGTSKTYSWTQPCGSPIPAGAVCTCNCVPGSYGLVDDAPAPVRKKTKPKPKAKPKTRTHRKSQACGVKIPAGYVCTCNCVPVCQAHRLNHPDPVVRTLAEELLYLMGSTEFGYLRWAAANAAPALALRIRRVMAAIGRGKQPAPHRWPRPSECTQRLHHVDEVIAIMAAQMLQQRGVSNRQMRPSTQRRMTELLDSAAKSPWFVRYGVAP